MPQQMVIRRYGAADAEHVRDLFITVNRQLAPPHLKDTFEGYIASALASEIEQIPEYYAARNGSFWVAQLHADLVGMFALEQHASGGMELRRMYVAPHARRLGVARCMLTFAENLCVSQGTSVLHLSTSELQEAALSFYRASGYRLVREEIAGTASNKTIGGGIRRYHFVKEFGS